MVTMAINMNTVSRILSQLNCEIKYFHYKINPLIKNKTKQDVLTKSIGSVAMVTQIKYSE